MTTEDRHQLRLAITKTLPLALTECHFSLQGPNRCEVLSSWAAGIAMAHPRLVRGIAGHSGGLLLRLVPSRAPPGLAGLPVLLQHGRADDGAHRHCEFTCLPFHCTPIRRSATAFSCSARFGWRRPTPLMIGAS